MVFRKESAPRTYAEFLDWYNKQTEWSEGHTYDDPAVTSPELRNWYMEMIRTFPAMNGPLASDDPDDDHVTDYSIGKDVIYAAFAWPLADEAYKVASQLAIKHSVGFFNASGDEGELIPSTYRIAKGWEIFIWITLPILMIVLGVGLIAPLMAGEFDATLALILVPVSLAVEILLFLGLLETKRSKLIVEEDRLVNVLAFETRTLTFDKIKGYRIGKNYLHFIPKDEKNKKKLKITLYIGGYQELMSWVVRRFPDVDAEGLEEEQEILNNEELGRTLEEREEKLKKTKNKTRVLNIAAWVVAVSTFFYPRYYQVQILLCSLIPIIGILLYRNSKGLVLLEDKKNPYFPDIGIALMIPSSILALRAMIDFTVFDYSNFWAPALIIATALGLLIFIGSPQKLSLKKGNTYTMIFVFLLVAGFYPYGFVVTTNAAFDESEPTYYKAEILNRRVSSGKSTTYYFELSPWGPETKAKEVSVSKDIYNSKSTGDSAVIYFSRGVYKIPYYLVVE